MEETIEIIVDENGITWTITRITDSDGVIRMENYSRE